MAASPNRSSGSRNSRRGPGDPWFTIGSVDVTTSVLIPLLVVVVWVAAAVDLSILKAVWLSRQSYQSGFVWQLFTWPFADIASVRTAIGLFFFWSFGRVLEQPLGPGRFLRFLAIGTVVTGLIALVLDRLASSDRLGSLLGAASENPVLAGPRLPAIAVAVCVAVEYPNIRAFFGIPIRALVAVFIAIDLLQALTYRDWLSMVHIVIAVTVFAIVMTAFGLGNELPSWVPRIRLPQWATGLPSYRRPATANKANKGPGLWSRFRGRGKGEGGSVVTGPWGEQGTGTASTSATSTRPTSMTRADREEVDSLLDKIAQSGMGSLSSDERSRLEEASRRLRESEGR